MAERLGLDSPKFFFRTTAPAFGEGMFVGDLWIDTSASPPTVRQCTVETDPVTWTAGFTPGFGAAGYPVDVGSTEADGTATTLPRSDHQHAHGSLTNSTPHRFYDLSGVAYVRKTVAESRTSNATLTNDNAFLFTIGANEIWIMDITAYMSAWSAVPDMQVAINGPVGMVPIVHADIVDVSSNTEQATGYAATLAAAIALINGKVGDKSLRVHALIRNGANAGTVNFQWAQNTSDAATITMDVDGDMLAVRVA